VKPDSPLENLERICLTPADPDLYFRPLGLEQRCQLLDGEPLGGVVPGKKQCQTSGLSSQGVVKPQFAGDKDVCLFAQGVLEKLAAGAASKGDLLHLFVSIANVLDLCRLQALLEHLPKFGEDQGLRQPADAALPQG